MASDNAASVAQPESPSATEPIVRYAYRGLWAMPAFAFLLGIGTITHQPPPQTQLADWSRYVTTDVFLYDHLIASIGGAVLGAIGAVALGIALARRGSVRLGLWGLLTGVSANVVLSSVFGVAAFAQPAIGRFYLAGHHELAQGLYYDAAQGTPMDVYAGFGILLLTCSIIVFGVSVARMSGLPRLAGIGFAVSAPLFAVVGFAFDNWIQSVASTLMTVSAIWIVIALQRSARREPAAGQARVLAAEAR
jgi:hypothetical protein